MKNKEGQQNNNKKQMVIYEYFCTFTHVTRIRNAEQHVEFYE